MASLPIRYRPEAAEELRDALLWYRSKDARVADRFGEELLTRLDEVADSPNHWPLQRDGTRQIHLAPFSYLLIVRELKRSLEVVAIAHTSRRSGYWRKRLS